MPDRLSPVILLRLDCPKECKEEAQTAKEITTVTYCSNCGDLIIPPGKQGLCQECFESDKPAQAAEILQAGKTLGDVPSELQDEAVDTVLGQISPKTGRYICVDCGGEVDAVGAYAQSGLCPSCSAELNRCVGNLETQWVKRVRSLDEIKQSIASELALAHRMQIEQAEKDFQAWLAGVVEEC